MAIAAGPARHELRLPLPDLPGENTYYDGAAGPGFWAFALPPGLSSIGFQRSSYYATMSRWFDPHV